MTDTTRTIPEIFSRQPAGGTSFSGSGDLFNKSHEASHEVIYSSEISSDGLPLWIFPRKGSTEDFFAEVATFYADLLPVSAFCHVIEKSIIGAIPKTKQAISNRRINACIGFSFAEVALRLARSGTSAAPTFAACRKSLSFTLCRAHHLYPDSSLDAPYDKWNVANQLLGPQSHPEVSEAVYRALEISCGKVAWPARPKSREIQALKALFSFINDVSMEDLFTDSLRSIYKNIDPLMERLAGSFDGRMAAFDQIVAMISSSSEIREIDGIAIGYFANLISSGSFAHLPILLKISKNYPAAIIWYGLFAGLNIGKSSSDSVLAIGRKIGRDLADPFNINAQPQSDVSIDELEILRRLPNLSNSLKPSFPRSLRISLLPGVDIFTNYSENQHSSHDDINEKRLAEVQKRQFRAKELIMMSLRALDETLEAVDSLSKSSNRRNSI